MKQLTRLFAAILTWTIAIAEPGPENKNPAEEYGPDEAGPWIEDALVWDASPIDLSFLNHTPAGKHGRVVAKADKLVFSETEAPVRFWSCNVAAQAAFGPEDEEEGKSFLRTQANRIAELGFNHVRLHHIDNKPRLIDGKVRWDSWSGPSIVDYTASDTLTFNPAALDRIDYFIHLLKERGIYVYIDFFNLRTFGAGDGLMNFEEMAQVSDEKYIFHLDPEIEENIVEFTRRLAAHKNPYTGLTWADEPAICMATLSNENDFTFFTTKRVLNNPFWNARVKEIATKYAEDGLPIDPENAVTFGTPDHNRFAAELEARVYSRMIESFREAGWDLLITGGNWTYRGPVSVSGKARASSFTDNHTYYSETAWLLDDPNHSRTIWAKVAAAHTAGLPFVISEWQTGRMAKEQMHLAHRATSVIGSAAVGAHQGWDTVSFFNYAQTHRQEGRVGGGYNGYIDPAHMGVMPAAAIAYRRDIAESPTTLVVEMDDHSTFSGKYDSWSPGTAEEPSIPLAFMTGMEKYRTAISFAKQDATPMVIPVSAEEHSKNFLNESNQVTTDTQQSTRNWREGWQTIDTPSTQLVHGFLGSRTFKTSDITFYTDNAYGLIALNALDDQALKSSKRILLTAMGRCDRIEDPKNPRIDHFRSQILGGTIEITLKDPSTVTLTPKLGNGTSLPTSRYHTDPHNKVIIPLDVAATHWFELSIE